MTTPEQQTPPVPNDSSEPPLVEEAVMEPTVPGEFVADPTLARQTSLPISPPNAVAIVGCGGVGSWIAYFLALAGVQKLLLFDGDRVSGTNLNRMPYGLSILGGKGTIDMPKTDALKGFILERRPQCVVECYPNFTIPFARAMVLQRFVPWIAVSTDSLQSRQEIGKWARDLGVCYVEASAEGDVGSIAGAPAEWSTPDETSPGYASVPVWVGPCVSAAAMACAHILHDNIHPETSVRIGWQDDSIRFTSHNENPPQPEVELAGQLGIRARGVLSALTPRVSLRREP